MTRSRIWYSAIAIFILSFTSTLCAKEQAIYVKEFIITADNHIVTPQLDIEKNAGLFNFDWNNDQTIVNNKDKVADVEKTYSQNLKNQNLNDEDKQAFGQLAYKLGTYYLHVLQEPDQAIQKLTTASRLLTNQQDKIWIDDNLAYAYAKKFEANNQVSDEMKAYSYLKQVFKARHEKMNAQALGFAYYVRGYIAHDLDQYDIAEDNYRSALKFYQKNNNAMNDTYIRIQNRLAHTLLHDGQDAQAIQLLQTVKNEWVSKNNTENNPYAARNFVDLGEAYLKIGNMEAAGNELTNALHIYQNVYGQNNNDQLRYPYHLLSYTYRSMLNTMGINSVLPRPQLLSRKICSTLLFT